MPPFDIQPTLYGPRLTLRPLEPGDRAALFRAASDREIWAQHPASDRAERAAFDPYFDFLIGAGGMLAAIETGTGRVIGCSGYYEVPDRPGEWAIGFTFLTRDRWGGEWNREMKALMLGHALAALPRIWLHIATENRRSQIASERLGARHDHDADLDLMGDGVSPNRCYVMTARDWETATGTPLARPRRAPL